MVAAITTSKIVPIRNPFAWNLSEKLGCWVSIYNGNLYFHIKGVDHSSSNNQYIFLTSDELDACSKALRSRTGGRFVLTEKPRKSKVGSLQVVFEVMREFDSTTPTELDKKAPVKLIGSLFTVRANTPASQNRCSIRLDTDEMAILRATFRKEMKVGFFY